jgi:hypothetical protein
MYIQNLPDAVNSFNPTCLNDMETVRLMDRIDTKFVVSVSSLPEILRRADGKYKVLEINNERDFEYHNVYLDTSDYCFFYQHVTGKLNRHKIRFRKYINTGSTFLEIKKRSNKNRTVKWRIQSQLSTENNLSNEAYCFISDHLQHNCIELKPVLVNRFRRFTLVNYDSNERITFDYDLRFSDTEGSLARLPYLSIIEVKRDGLRNRSQVCEILKESGVHPTGFSKYCMGAAVMKDLPHKNNLKSKFLLINKIENEYFRSIYA